MADKITAHTFSIHLFGRAVPMLCTFVALPHDRDNVKLSVTHALTTTSFVVPLSTCEGIITVLRNAMLDARTVPLIEPVVPAVPVQSDGEGAAG